MNGGALKRDLHVGRPASARFDLARMAKISARCCTIGVSAATIVACLILSACGAITPVKYYRLDVVPSGAPSSGATYPVTLILGQISAPDLFRDNKLVYSLSLIHI